VIASRDHELSKDSRQDAKTCGQDAHPTRDCVIDAGAAFFA